MANSKSARNVKKRSNWAGTIIVGGLTLLLAAVFNWILLEAKNFLDITQENINLYVELSNNSDLDTQQAIHKKLQGIPQIKSESVRLISKEEGFRQLQEEMGDDLSYLDIGNPLSDVIQFNLVAGKLNKDSLENLKRKLEEEEAIEEMVYQEHFLSKIGSNIQKFVGLSVLLCILFFFSAFLTISHTIKLSMHNDRFLIRNMELVGASKSFIRAPYLKKGLLIGLGCSLIAILGLFLLQTSIQQQLPDIEWSKMNYLLWICVILAGPIISYIASWFSINKYLNAKLDDLY